MPKKKKHQMRKKKLMKKKLKCLIYIYKINISFFLKENKKKGKKKKTPNMHTGRRLNGYIKEA